MPEIIKVKVKLSRNKSWRLRMGMEYWASVLILTFGTVRAAELSAVLAGLIYPQGTSLELIC
jgi:hypothetical protein